MPSTPRDKSRARRASRVVARAPFSGRTATKGAVLRTLPVFLRRAMHEPSTVTRAAARRDATPRCGTSDAPSERESIREVPVKLSFASSATVVLASLATASANGGCASTKPPAPAARVEARSPDAAEESARPSPRTEPHLEGAEDKVGFDLRESPASNRRAKEALESLRPIAALSEGSLGTVVRLPDSVLFEGETAALMPTAHERLDRVARALNEVNARSILVRGHMDRSGDDPRDLDLSKLRATAVREYLVSRGLDAKRVRAEGIGNAEPAMSNASPEGRHDNQRIEIIVDEARASGAPP
jgi:outer membrane protein OmpA-like peptidoglycan-associated protein